MHSGFISIRVDCCNFNTRVCIYQRIYSHIYDCYLQFSKFDSFQWAVIESTDFSNVIFTKFLPLAYGILSLQGFSCNIAVFGVRYSTKVHDRSIVITNPLIVDGERVTLFKAVFLPFVYVLIEDLHVCVPIGPCLLMPEASHMSNGM
jgi:hypothetical protein